MEPAQVLPSPIDPANLKDLMCPVSHVPLDRAMFLSPCGHRIQKAAIEKWFGENKGFCPSCQKHVISIKPDRGFRLLVRLVFSQFDLNQELPRFFKDSSASLLEALEDLRNERLHPIALHPNRIFRKIVQKGGFVLRPFEETSFPIPDALTAFFSQKQPPLKETEHNIKQAIDQFARPSGKQLQCLTSNRTPFEMRIDYVINEKRLFLSFNTEVKFEFRNFQHNRRPSI